MDFAKYGDAYVGIGGTILIAVDENRVPKQRPCNSDRSVRQHLVMVIMRLLNII